MDFLKGKYISTPGISNFSLEVMVRDYRSMKTQIRYQMFKLNLARISFQPWKLSAIIYFLSVEFMFLFISTLRCLKVQKQKKTDLPNIHIFLHVASKKSSSSPSNKLFSIHKINYSSQTSFHEMSMRIQQPSFVKIWFRVLHQIGQGQICCYNKLRYLVT